MGLIPSDVPPAYYWVEMSQELLREETLSISGNVSNFAGIMFKKSAEPEKDFYSRFIAHRGANNAAPDSLLPQLPENSLPSLREAYAKGALYVECDVHLTRDGRIIILHDDRLERTARYNPDLATSLSLEHFNAITNKLITELSYEQELSQVDVGAYSLELDKKYLGTKIPLLEEFLFELKDHPERSLFIELKAGEQAIVYVLQDLLTKYKAAYQLQDQQILIMSFDYQLVKLSKSLLPMHRHLMLTIAEQDKEEIQEDPQHPGEVHGLYYRIKNKDDLERYLILAKKANLDGIDVEYDPKIIDTDFVQRIHQQGLMAVVWTYSKDDTLAMAGQMLAAGADLINTNQPEFIFDALKKASQVAQGNGQEPIKREAKL